MRWEWPPVVRDGGLTTYPGQAIARHVRHLSCAQKKVTPHLHASRREQTGGVTLFARMYFGVLAPVRRDLSTLRHLLGRLPVAATDGGQNRLLSHARFYEPSESAVQLLPSWQATQDRPLNYTP